jgi:hypothetical protein
MDEHLACIPPFGRLVNVSLIALRQPLITPQTEAKISIKALG